MTRAQRRARANSLVEKSFRKEKIARACPSFFFLSRTRKKENVVGARFLSSKQKRAERPVRRVARRPRISLFFFARALRVFVFSRLTEKNAKTTKAASEKKRRKTRKFRRRRDDRERPRFRARAASARERKRKKKKKKENVREKRLSRTKRIFLFRFSLFFSRGISRFVRARKTTKKRLRISSAPKSNYELFNCNNSNICHWSWNYRGCWHQTCPPIVPRRKNGEGFELNSFRSQALSFGVCVVISCHYLPASGLGNLRACCLPWKW